MKRGGETTLEWGCFRSLVIGSQSLVAGIMNVEMYRDVLAKTILSYASAYTGLGFFPSKTGTLNIIRAQSRIDSTGAESLSWTDQTSHPTQILSNTSEKS